MNEIQESHHACNSSHRNASRYFQNGHVGTESTAASRRFRKEDLSNVRVINQVDRKFVACLLRDEQRTVDSGDQDSGTGDSQALVLIDQHAADERIRVERFLKDLCLGFLHHSDHFGGVTTRTLTPSVPVLLTRHEALCLAQSDTFQRAFECWGILFDDLSSMASRNWDDDLDDTSGVGYVQIFVRNIPAVVGDKVSPDTKTTFW